MIVYNMLSWAYGCDQSDIIKLYLRLWSVEVNNAQYHFDIGPLRIMCFWCIGIYNHTCMGVLRRIR